MRESETGLRLEGRSGYLGLDRFNGGGLAGWELRSFAPFARLGRLEFNSRWQEAPLVDEVPARFTWRTLPFGVQVRADFRIGGLDFRRTWLVANDLATCQMRLHCFHRSFSYLAPAVYRLNPAAFGRRGRFLMVAEGGTRVAAEPLARFHQIHHLGSELVGFAAAGGLAGLAVNRLVSSPILRRRPLSGTFILMDSRPIGAADNAYPYQFAREPELELTLRLAVGSEPLPTFRAWQSFQDRPALLRFGRPPLQPSRLEWTKEIAGLTEVNPYF
ncbi:MAG: hypothetical protein BWY73_00626 [candidate division TA06 bacterium ADurb.Bin417]|uniref:Uncharacterized protein n=1 Tax=candidate division TA06 bacterium ADurb.Bin417 TaxID=1852828 RepID=A0A1V5MHT6_UNCT6|nr:MAG: hypothetical protein BWY73_00626 [candidate division TA06 bacterium ADurb.Bin417]